MRDAAKTPQELHERLTQKFLAARCRNDSSGSIHNPQADVSVMMAFMFEHIEAAFKQNAWPELTGFLIGKSGVDKNDFVAEHVRNVHLLVADYIKAAYVPTEEQKLHMTFEQTLDSLGWHSQPMAARVAYVYMLGLFHMSRCWVIGRQSNELGISPERGFEDIAAAAGVELRMYDQRINPTIEARNTLRDSVVYAQQLGMSRDSIIAEVDTTLRDSSLVSRAMSLVKTAASRLYDRVNPPTKD